MKLKKIKITKIKSYYLKCDLCRKTLKQYDANGYINFESYSKYDFCLTCDSKLNEIYGPTDDYL